jgi:hypothetical protein
MFDVAPACQPPGVGTERRAAERFSCLLESSYQLVGAGPEDARPAQVRNISTTGVALLLHRPVEPGTALSLELSRADGTTGRRLIARAVHLKPQSRTEWLIGCALVTQLTERELQELL